MADRARGANGAASRPRAAPPPVRRNLFQSQLTRRPTPSSSNSAESLHQEEEPLPETSDIVVRDEDGDIVIGDPPVPALDPDEAQETHREHEEERQRLEETLRHRLVGHPPVVDQPEELLEQVRAGMRAKVAALAEDNWMYEPEEHPRV
ncbi:hypothetical protein B0I35DRAFT_479060 [Stachybotrys elegans]|uniref:Uncharacterized protein n=1 Tax=Stachybotrys elegans TaxID=80388 RepID=A0A8K0WRA6_9HYPO|nr:hypothetical protein B0I35DRAFT_479060 [Stachybotrys elegans]